MGGGPPFLHSHSVCVAVRAAWGRRRCYNWPMGRTRRRRRANKPSGGALSSLRGGFRSVAHSVTGQKPARPTSRGRRLAGNVLTLVFVAVAVWLLLRRFGLLHR